MPDLQILRDELTNDPDGLGYSGMENASAADAMNVNNRQRNRAIMSGDEIMPNVVLSEQLALTNAQLTTFNNLINVATNEGVDPFGWAASQIASIFGSGSGTAQALLVSRVEQVAVGVAIDWGFVGEGDIEDARQP